MVWPANDGSCWKCGGKLESSPPMVKCACGCGQSLRMLDPQGRRSQYVRGHNPRGETLGGLVPAAPFRDYLERALDDFDILGALARAHGVGREEVVRVLKGEDEEIDRKMVSRALWTGARGGLGKGLKPHPDAPTFFDLYPEDARSRKCPGCGEGKSPHAELCKQCRIKRARTMGPKQATSPTRLSEAVVREAHRLYMTGMTLLEAAEAVQPRSPNRNAESIKQALSKQWKRLGLPVRTAGESRQLAERRRREAQLERTHA